MWNGTKVSVALALLASLGAGVNPTPPRQAEPRPPIGLGPHLLNRLSLTFEPNEGQADPEVKFLAHGDGYTVFLTLSGPVMTFRKPKVPSPKLAGAQSAAVAVRLKLAGANPRPVMEALEPLPARANYFIGHDRSGWRTGIPTYRRVVYHKIYAGIDLAFYGGAHGRLEYDFLVSPGANPNQIRLSFEGAAGIGLDSHGDLLLRTAAGELRQHRPVNHQEIGGVTKLILGRYVIRRAGQASIQLAEYDATKPLVIDPVLEFASYLGSSGDDWATGVAADSFGNIYVTGVTGTTDFPITRGTLPSAPSSSGFLCKFDPTGLLLYSTHLGPSSGGLGVVAAPDGSSYVLGFTTSHDFPTTPGAFQASFTASGSFFVSKLNGTGSALVYSTLLGGLRFITDPYLSIAADGSGSVYVTGSAYGLPTTPGAYQTTPVTKQVSQYFGDSFVAKLNPSGTALVYSTLLEFCTTTGIAVDASGNAVVTGEAGNGFQATPGAFQLALAGGSPLVGRIRGPDAFVAKLSATGSALIYSTFLGGSGDETGTAVTIDALGNAYVTGVTDSRDFPTTPRAYQPDNLRARWMAFVTKLDPTGSTLIYSTYLGGSGNDPGGTGIAVDGLGNAFVAGETASADFPTTPGAFQTAMRGQYAPGFLTELNGTGTSLLYSTYLSGASPRAVAVDQAGNALVAGLARKDFVATPGAFQTTLAGGNSDAFIAKVYQGLPTISVTAVTNAASFQGGAVAPGEIVTIFGSAMGPITLVPLSLTPLGFLTGALGGTQVLFDGTTASLIYAQANQISAVVPYEVAGKTGVQVKVTYGQTESNPFTVGVMDTAPGIFSLDASGQGQGAIVNQDGTINSAKNAAEKGSVVSIYATGEGQTDPPGIDGKIAGDVLPRPRLTVSARISGLPADVLYAGGAPGLVAGVLQVNVRVPVDADSGADIPVVLIVGNSTSPKVTMAVP